MILTTISKAILDRIKADTGAAGIYYNNYWNYISGAWAITGTPSSTTFPYLVYGIRLDADHSLPADEFKATVTFTVYDDLTQYADDATFAQRISIVLDRLHGNAVLQSGRIPTYGFHRHGLVLETNGYSAKASTCNVISYETGMTDEHTLYGTMVMTFRVTALAANP